MMATSLLNDLPLDDVELTRQKVEIIERAARRADRLIRDLMDITRIGNGKMQLEPQEFGAAEALAEAAQLAAAEAQRKGITITVVPLEWPLTAHADRHRVLQALDNLIGNAVKFTPKNGQVTLSTASAPEGIMFEVRDTGPGIPPAEQANMFRPFWQARRVDRRGVGLGLSIVKGIVDAHGGRIDIESDGESGTTIRFTVPAAQETAAAAGTVTTESPAQSLSSVSRTTSSNRAAANGF
jgi:signal transduction histidine kinase